MKIHKNVKEDQIRKTCASFVGEITQKPPVRSAVKRVKRQRQIYYFDVKEIHERDVLFRVGCEAGTYIRTLCVDIGKKLGVGAQLDTLRRTKVGQIQEQDLVHLQDVKDAFVFWKEEHDDTPLKQVLHPIEYLLGHIPKVVIRDSAVDAVCHGADLAIPGVVEVDTAIQSGDHVALMSLKGEGVAMGTALLSTEQMIEKDTGKCVTLDRVFMNKGTYPSTWKRVK
jgi:H/ACA ribonucleoprotein complex subunit 4